MQVFISWSGDTSRALAEALADWLPGVIQAVRPYYSPTDVDKGALWESEIAQSLEASDVGLLCVTRDNINAPWLVYEAGALSKGLGKSCVVPILFGLKATDIKGPLAGRQAASFTRDDMRKVLKTINEQASEGKLAQVALDTAFDKWWPELEERVERVLEQAKTPPPPRRPVDEMVEEILQLLRAAHLRPLPLDRGSMRAIQNLFAHYIALAQAADEHGFVDISLKAFRTSILASAEHLLTNPHLPFERANGRLILERLHKAMDALGKKRAIAGATAPFEDDEDDDDLPF